MCELTSVETADLLQIEGGNPGVAVVFSVIVTTDWSVGRRLP
jgi:hypothetical protein